jgi:hypothetical protein
MGQKQLWREIFYKTELHRFTWRLSHSAPDHLFGTIKVTGQIIVDNVLQLEVICLRPNSVWLVLENVRKLHRKKVQALPSFRLLILRRQPSSELKPYQLYIYFFETKPHRKQSKITDPNEQLRVDSLRFVLLCDGSEEKFAFLIQVSAMSYVVNSPQATECVSKSVCSFCTSWIWIKICIMKQFKRQDRQIILLVPFCSVWRSAFRYLKQQYQYYLTARTTKLEVLFLDLN